MSIRRGLLVGINAYTHSNPLRGCINDVKQMQGVLSKYYGFAADSFKILLDQDATLANITTGLAWLAEGGDDADAVRVFHYSGHGYFVPDTNGDEPDGRDEVLVPVDHDSAGFLTDDALKVIYDRFPKSGNLTLIMDSCHSGTVQRDVADTVYRFIPATQAHIAACDAARATFEQAQEDHLVAELGRLRSAGALPEGDALRDTVRDLIKGFQKARFGDVRVRENNVLISGCRTDQTSADAHIGGDYHGALTYHLVDALEKANGALSYRELVTGAANQLEQGGYSQVPQLEYKRGRDQSPAFKPF
jgi:metacaspase-1